MGQVSLECQTNQTLSFLVSWTDVSSVPINVSGYSANLKIVDPVDITSVLASLSSAAGQITFPAPASGQISIVVPVTTVSGWTPGNYLYDLIVISPTNVATPLIPVSPFAVIRGVSAG